MRHLTAAFLLVSLSAAGVVAVASRATEAQGQGPTLQPDFVGPAIRHEKSKRRLGDIPKKGQVGPKRENHVRPVPMPAGAEGQDTAVQSIATAGLAIAQGPGFDGIGEQWDQAPYNVQYAPSDINGAAGVTQYVQWVNTSFAVFRKSDGLLLAGPTLGNTLWDGFGGNCETENDGDPIVQFDKAASRWVMTQFQVSAQPYSQCVAVSETEDATGNYFLYEFTYPNFPDYPKLGVWPNAYLITFNMFNGNFLGPRACAYERARMLQGLSATQVCFQLSNSNGSMLPGDLDGPTPPPAGSPGFFMAFASNSLRLWRLNLDWAAPGSATLIGPTSMAVPPYTRACGGGTCIPQAGTTQQLDSLGDRLMYRLAYRNFGSHQSLVVNHAVSANGTSGIRWYEVRNPQGTPQVFQASTYAPDLLYRWMGSAAMDKFGNLAIGYSVSSASSFPAIRLAGREATAPVNTLTLETTIIDSAGSQTGLSRWGDYTAISVDPVDDCTFWYTNQYLKSTGSFNWSTRVAWFKFDSCGGVPPPTPDFSIDATPTSRTVTAGGATTYAVTSSPVGGFNGQVTLTAVGLPAGATMTFNPADFASGSGTSSASLTTQATLAPSTYNFTVTGTSGALAHSAPLTLVVNPAVIPDFTIAVSPGHRSIKANQATNYTVTVTRINGFTGPIDFSVTGVPPNTTSGFSPDPTTGNSSTLSLDTAGNTPKTTYTLTVQAAGGGVSRTATITLQVR